MDSLLGANANTDKLKLENTVTTSDLDSFTDNGLWRHPNLSKQPLNLYPQSLSLNINALFRN